MESFHSSSKKYIFKSDNTKRTRKDRLRQVCDQVASSLLASSSCTKSVKSSNLILADLVQVVETTHIKLVDKVKTINLHQACLKLAVDLLSTIPT